MSLQGVLDGCLALSYTPLCMGRQKGGGLCTLEYKIWDYDRVSLFFSPDSKRRVMQKYHMVQSCTWMAVTIEASFQAEHTLDPLGDPLEIRTCGCLIELFQDVAVVVGVELGFEEGFWNTILRAFLGQQRRLPCR